MLNKYGQAGGLNAGLSLWLPLDDLGAGAVNTTPVSAAGSPTATFTRAGATATTTLSSGLISPVIGANVARSCYSPAGVYLGYLAEQASTNLMLWSRDFTNAAWTKTSVTAALDQVGADGAANSASSLTATGANGTALQTITQAATSATLSFDVKRITGTGQVLIQQGATTLDITASINSSTWSRVTLNASVLNPAIGFKIVTSGDKIAVDYGGFENLPFATSRIPTTTVAATRNADVLTYPSAGNALASAGAAYAEVQIPTVVASPVIIGTNNAGIGAVALYAGAATDCRTTDGANAATKTGLADMANGVRKRASSWGGTSGLVVTGDGATPATATFAAGSFAATLGVGCQSNGGNQLNGTIKNVRIWTRALADSQMVSLTQ